VVFIQWQRDEHRPMTHDLALVGRVRLTSTLRRCWRELAGEVPWGVRTAEALRRWVDHRKAAMAAQSPQEDFRSACAALDALFELSTGLERPSGPDDATVPEPRSQTVRHLTVHAGGRRELERELLALVLRDEGDGDRAKQISSRLAHRAQPESVPAGPEARSDPKAT
jgi:hypothetical protein